MTEQQTPPRTVAHRRLDVIVIQALVASRPAQ
jgi:hypothetical protein